jgi:hypothetical protein
MAAVMVLTVFMVLFPGPATASSRQNTAPEAVIDAPENGDVFDPGEVVHFDASSSSDPEDDALTYFWDFGDGSTGTGVTPFHIYQTPWVPVVTLTVDDGALNDTARVVIVIGSGGGQNMPPSANISEPSNGDTFEVGVNIVFDGSNSEDPENDPLAYQWQFGDQNSSNSMIAMHAYAQTGVYVVTLIVFDGMFVDSARVVIRVDNTPPIADAGEDMIGFLNTDLVFDGTNSSDPDRFGNIVNYTWDLGDWTVRYGATVTHRYQKYGTFEVLLTVKDDNNGTDSDELEVTIINQKPVSVLDIKTEDTVVDVDIEFDASGSYDPDGTIERYNYNFGDGTETDWIEDRSIFHRYGALGTYMVSLITRDNMDAISEPFEIEVDIIIKVNQPPTVSITYPRNDDQVAETVNILGTATDPDNPVETVELKIDDGSWKRATIVDTVGNTVDWKYDWDSTIVEDGQHTVTARAYDGKKYSGESAIDIQVNNRPTTFIEITESLKPDEALPGEEVKVSGTAKYDTNVPVKNTEVRIDIPEASKSWTTKTNSQGRYSYEFDAPDNPHRWYPAAFQLREIDGDQTSGPIRPGRRYYIRILHKRT